jgi:hypothetical protein
VKDPLCHPLLSYQFRNYEWHRPVWNISTTRRSPAKPASQIHHSAGLRLVYMFCQGLHNVLPHAILSFQTLQQLPLGLHGFLYHHRTRVFQLPDVQCQPLTMVWDPSIQGSCLPPRTIIALSITNNCKKSPLHEVVHSLIFLEAISLCVDLLLATYPSQGFGTSKLGST